MTLKEQDVLVLLKLLVRDDGSFTYPGLAAAGLFNPHTRTTNRAALLEFLVHGLRYVFVPERAGMTRGIPTAHAAPPLVSMLAPTADPPPVWPDPEGTVRGEGFSPLYKSVPEAARNDEQLYELLALVDAIRAGRSRERGLAETMLAERLAR